MQSGVNTAWKIQWSKAPLQNLQEIPGRKTEEE